MNKEELINTLKVFFPGSFSEKSEFKYSDDGQLILKRLLEMSDSPIHVTCFNQLLHLNHEAGVSDGFFKYYFCSEPKLHPYPVDKIFDIPPKIDEKGISSLRQMEWGLRRFYTDALLFWGDILSAFREMRIKSYSEIRRYFCAKRFDPEQMLKRGDTLKFCDIPKNDRYFVAEVVCKAFDRDSPEKIKEDLIDAYRDYGEKRVEIKMLLDTEADCVKMAEKYLDEGSCWISGS